MRNDWITNDPRTAKALRAVDRQHKQMRKAAARLALADKIAALRAADAYKTLAYEAALAGFHIYPARRPGLYDVQCLASQYLISAAFDGWTLDQAAQAVRDRANHSGPSTTGRANH